MHAHKLYVRFTSSHVKLYAGVHAVDNAALVIKQCGIDVTDMQEWTHACMPCDFALSYMACMTINAQHVVSLTRAEKHIHAQLQFPAGNSELMRGHANCYVCCVQAVSQPQPCCNTALLAMTRHPGDWRKALLAVGE